MEDERYVVDSMTGNYKAETDEREYYRINGKFYEQDQIIQPLMDNLTQGGTAVLRTDYTLSDDEFANIHHKVSGLSGSKTLEGYYWMGVICLRDEG